MTKAKMKKRVAKILNALDSENLHPWIDQISVVLTNDAKIRVLNREFRRKDKATDVLSFPQYTPKELKANKKAEILKSSSLGDLVISDETLIKQAQEFGVTREAELDRLLIHGILHLCGYDHEKVSAREAQRMRRKERAIFKILNGDLA